MQRDGMVILNVYCIRHNKRSVQGYVHLFVFFKIHITRNLTLLRIEPLFVWHLPFMTTNGLRYKHLKLQHPVMSHFVLRRTADS
jgi:hypothetical protein